MLTKKELDSRKRLEYSCLEQLVPQNHLLRKIDKIIDFDFIYDEVGELYSTVGRPSVDPVVLIKIVMIQYLFGIPSMRQTIREIEVNLAYRWFLGYSISEKIPHFSTFNKNYERRFKSTNLFNNIFFRILEIAEENGLIEPTQIYIDSTHIKASANKKKYTKVNVKVEAKKYQDKLNAEIDEDRKKHKKKPLNKKIKTQEKEIIKSTTDNECGMLFKSEKEKCFAYLAHTACDDNNFILDFHITPANVHDSVAFEEIFSKVNNKYNSRIIATAVDAGYVTPYIAKTIFDANILPAMPYKRPMTKKEFFKKYEYVYDEYNDCYICPNNKILKYSTTNKDGYKEFKSNPKDCVLCPQKDKCTQSKNNQKLILRHLWQNYLDEANHLRHESYIKSVYSRRKETIERVFADAKERHGMRFTHLRGLVKITFETGLIFACMNLKKIANKLWKRNKNPFFIPSINLIMQILYYETLEICI